MGEMIVTGVLDNRFNLTKLKNCELFLFDMDGTLYLGDNVYEGAIKLMEDLPEKSADIIERHMWPAGHSKMPNSLEGVIVSAADKYAAVKDLICGSEIKHTGIRNTVRSCFDRTSELTR